METYQIQIKKMFEALIHLYMYCLNAFRDIVACLILLQWTVKTSTMNKQNVFTDHLFPPLSLSLFFTSHYHLLSAVSHHVFYISIYLYAIPVPFVNSFFVFYSGYFVFHQCVTAVFPSVSCYVYVDFHG